MGTPRRKADGSLGTRTLADEGLDASDIKLLQDIDRVGWHVILIPEEDGTPGWAFSIGLFRTFGHPEIAVFGLPLDVAGPVINHVGQLVSQGEDFTDGQEAEGLLEGVRCQFRVVRQRWYRPFLGYARWY